jgi:heptosyltransferase-3
MASLIYHAGDLGDFITILPAAALWRRAHRGEPLVLLGKPVHAALAFPAFDETWDVEGRMFAPLFSGSALMETETLARLGRVGSALVFARPESPLPHALADAGVKEIVRQDPFPAVSMPIVDYHLSLFPRVTDDERIPRISASSVEMTGLPPVVLHPGSGSQKKNWPLERFLGLARCLVERGESVAWVLGPAEEAISIPTGDAAWRLLPLRELAGRLARCRLFVGNDSGVTHLSAASGCPTVALFGDSDHLTWAPRGRKVAIVASSTQSVEGIELGDVLSVCQDLVREK